MIFSVITLNYFNFKNKYFKVMFSFTAELGDEKEPHTKLQMYECVLYLYEWGIRLRVMLVG